MTTDFHFFRQEAPNERIYTSKSGYFTELQKEIADFQKRYPGTDWSECCRLLSGTPRRTEYTIAVRHLVKWGAADVSILESHWNVTLPAWFHEFYSQVSECVLTWRNIFHVLHPREIIELETMHRKAEGLQHLPVRLIRFVGMWLSADCFALRLSHSDNRWRIVYTSLDETTETFQSAALDGMVSDDDMSAWLNRMSSTDGHPAYKGRDDDDEPAMMHRVQSVNT